jgi:CelD/BcsL family acetyltransferase involved in cellulose biosynthesis
VPTPAVTFAPPSPEAGSRPPPALSVVVADGPIALADHVAAWEDLATATLEPNVFCEPWMLLPALRAFGAGLDLRFVLVYAMPPDAPPLLCGFFPVERQRRYRGLPLSVLRLWQHKHCFLGTPLLRASHAHAALAAFLDWAGAAAHSALLQVPLVPADGPFADLLAELCNERGRRMLVTDRHARGLLVPGVDADTYLQNAVSSSSRRAMKRRHKRLAEIGRLDCDAVAGDEAAAWAEDFLQLEAAGWKGQLGTALAASAVEAAFFRAIIAEAARRRRLLTLALRMDGRTIGCRCAFLAGDGAFAFKSAYDEEFAAFSPGLLLELENIRQCHALPSLRWMDSCTSPDNDMINRLWHGRRVFHTVTIASRAAGAVAITMLHLLQRLRRRCRR